MFRRPLQAASSVAGSVAFAFFCSFVIIGCSGGGGGGGGSVTPPVINVKATIDSVDSPAQVDASNSFTITLRNVVGTPTPTYTVEDLNAGTGTLSGNVTSKDMSVQLIAPSRQVGDPDLTVNYEVTVVNSEGSDTENFSVLIIAPVNPPPQPIAATIDSVDSPTQVVAGQAFTVTLKGVAGSPTPTYQIDDLTGGTVAASGTVSGTDTNVQLIAPSRQVGDPDVTWNYRATVTNSAGSDTEDFSVLVIAPSNLLLASVSGIEGSISIMTSNQPLYVNALGLTHYNLALYRYYLEVDGVKVSFALILSDVHGEVLLPQRDTAGTVSCRIVVEDKANLGVTFDRSNPVNLTYNALTTTYVGFDGEDGAPANQGQIFSFEVGSTGTTSNLKMVAAGNGHQLYGGFARASSPSFIYSSAVDNAGWTAKLYKVDLSTVASQPFITIPTSQTAPHPYHGIGRTRGGNAVMLVDTLGGSFTVWEVAADLSAMSPTVITQLGIGSTIAAFDVVFHKESGQAQSDYALIAVSSPEQALYMARLQDQTYARIDLGGFITQSMSVIRDPESCKLHLTLVGQQGGIGIKFLGISLGQLSVQVGTPRSLIGGGQDVVGAFHHYDEINGKYLIGVVRDGSSLVDILDMATTNTLFTVVLPGPPTALARPQEAKRADGVNGFVVGYDNGSGVAGAMIVRWDGTITDIAIAGSAYNCLAIGDQVVAVEGRNFHQAMVYHGPTDSQAIAPPLYNYIGGMSPSFGIANR